MAEQDNTPDWKTSTNGESAWKEARERVASRNAEARKSGKLRRDAYERERDNQRRAREAQRQAVLLNSRPTPRSPH
jgi:hypothetical protein